MTCSFVCVYQNHLSTWFLCPSDIGGKAVQCRVDTTTHEVVYLGSDGQQLRRLSYRDMPAKPWSSDEWPQGVPPTRHDDRQGTRPIELAKASW